MNKFKPKKNIAATPKKSKIKKARNFLSFINIAGWIDRNTVIRLMPYIFFLTFLAIIYIANSYYAEKTIRDIDSITTELKELRSEYISNKSEVMFRSKQSQVANQVRSTGLEESVVPPKKIQIKKEE